MKIRSQCCTCGYQWPTGHDGSHSCSENLLKKLDEWKAVFIETQRLLKNDSAIVDTVWSDTAENTTLYELIEITINKQ